MNDLEQKPNSSPKKSLVNKLTKIILLPFESGKLPISKVVFLAMVTILTIIHLFGTFKGMSDPQAMQHAQQGREILRGNGPQTKVITPADIYNQLQNGKQVQLLNQTDTYSAPLYSYVNAGILALVDGANTEKHKVPNNKFIYDLDRVLAGAALLFFLIAIFINYLLAKRLFDEAIANTTAILMLLSATMWQFVQSSLPQMFLLMIFSLVLYLTILAFQQYELTARTPWRKLAVCAICFGILALTKWLLLWMFLGYLIFVLIHFKPRGAVAALSIFIVAAMISPALVNNYNNYGSPLGAAGLSIVNGMADTQANTEEIMLRNTADIFIDLQGLALNMVKNCFVQFDNMIRNFAGIIVAPLFFLGLLHMYRRSTNNHIKWGVFLMWIFSLLGMAIFGAPSTEVSANQLHLLFAPVMAMFGLSVVSMMWSRLPIARSLTMISSSHFFIVVIISSGSLLTSLPQGIKKSFESFGGQPNSPYFHPAELSTKFKDALTNDSAKHEPIVYSDQPSAVAWYGDTHAIWLPLKPEQIESIDAIAKQEGVTISGIHLSATSMKNFYENQTYAELFPLVGTPFRAQFTNIKSPPGLQPLEGIPLWSNIAKRYPVFEPLIRTDRAKNAYGHNLLQLREEEE